MKSLNIFIFLALIMLFGCKSNNSNDPDMKTPQIQYELSGGAGHYDYAPSAIEDKYGIRYMFLCENRDPFKIVDYVYLYKGIPTKNGYVWQPGTEIIAPSESGWDNIHICDPDVRAFDFTYKGEQYHWIMTYLGVDQWDCKHNQIGLAYSKNIEGPYIKYDLNPLISYTDTTRWGVGQSTTIVLDSEHIQLFYTSSLRPGGGTCVRTIKMNCLDSIEIGEERLVPFMKSNTYVACSKKNMYGTTEDPSGQPKVRDIPTWVVDAPRVAYRPLTSDLFSEKDEWIEIDRIRPEDTGFPRNHNAGILTDEKGYLKSDKELVVYFTVAVTGENWLWSYDLYSATYDIRDLEK